MKTITLKKALLAGTAIVAVGALTITPARADQDTLAGSVEWGNAGTAASTLDDGTDAAAGDDVNLVTFALTVTDDSVNSDGTASLNFVLGDVTGTTGDLAIVDAALGDGTLVVTVDSFLTSSTGDFTVNAIDAETGTIAVTVTTDLNTGGVLSVINTETSSADTVLLTVSDDLTVTGATTLTAGAFAGATSGITVTDDVALTAAATVTGGAGAGSLATFTIGGDATFTGGLNLVTNDKSILVLNGTAAQAVSGVISGAGDITVSNTSSVTFTGDSTFTGELTVNNDTNDQTVTFNGDFAGGIFLGDNVTADIITANFNGTTQAIALGIVGGAAETVNVNFLGGSTITLSGAASSGIDTTAITGSTTVTTNQDYASTNITVASGSTLATTANTITGAIANAGTLVFGGGSVTGAITGAGLLDVNAGGTFTGALTQGTADIAAFTLTQGAASGYTVGTTNFSGAGTLALLGGAQTITGNFTNTTDGQGTITITDVAATTAIVGDLGASTAHSLLALTIAGGGANVTTTTGNLFVDGITQNAADTLSFVGTSPQTVSGTITGGILNVASGADVTFDGVIGGASETVTGTATFNANNTLTGTHTNTGTTNVGVGAVLSAATLTDAGSYVLKANDANLTLATADFGSLTDTGGGAATLTAANLSIDVTGQLAAGTVLLLTHINTGAATLADNSFQYSFVTADAGADTNVVVTRASLESLAEGSATSGIGAQLDDLTASADVEIAAYIDNLAAAPDAEAFNDLLEAGTSSVDGGSLVGAQAFGGQTAELNSTRLAALRTGSETGMAAGEVAHGTSVWAQGFGTTGNQDERDGVSGFDVDSLGVAVGIDTTNLNDAAVIGLALAYAATDVESDNLTRTETDIDSYQIALYGDYDIDSRTYVSGQLSFIWGDNDSTRHDVGGISDLDAQGDYDSQQYGARAELGRDFLVGGSTTLTPKGLVNYAHYSTDSYTETGAGGLNLNVDNDDVNIFEVGVGVDASWDVKHNDGSWCEPVLSAGIRHDFIGDEVQATNSFTGGGTTFSAEGADPADTTINLGAALTYHAVTNWDLKVGYDFEAKQDYTSHSAVARASYKF